MGNLFGTDGVRAVANLELTPDLAMGIARAAARVLAPGAGRARFLVGRDTRISGDLLEAAAVAGLCSAGVDALLGDVMPSPAVAYLVREMRLDGGIMISASHNPYEYNGLKFFGAGGDKLSDDQESRIEVLAAHCPPLEAGHGVGRVVRESGLIERYCEGIKGLAATRLEGLRVVADCGHGALHELAPRVLAALGAQVIAMNCSPTGVNINEGGALKPDGLAREVVLHGADAGVAFDGDGDRAVLADEKGEMIDGDQVLAAWARDLHARGRLRDGIVVGTVTTNGGLETYLHSIGCRLLRAAVGDRYVSDEMRARSAVLGGEACGHVIFAPHLYSADGLLAAAMMLGLAARTGEPLSALGALMSKRPQVTVNASAASARAWQSDVLVREAVWQAERMLGPAGRLVVRASGTEPVIRITAECDDERLALSAAQQVARAVDEGMGARKRPSHVQSVRLL